MTTSGLAERDAAQQRGSQRPRICHVPPYAASTGDEAVELAEMAGLVLDDWQRFVLKNSLGERADGRWSAQTVGLMVSRQNGKGAILEARELAGLYLLGEQIVHTAHLFDTAADHFARVSQRIEDTPELSRRLAKRGGILRGHGNESITLTRDKRTGRIPKLEFRTRTGSGGLGKSARCLVFDEAMIISDEMLGALVPTLSAQKNVQLWFTGSAVDQENPAHDGVAFARIRERGIRGSDPGLMYMEWSLDYDNPDDVPEDIGEDELAQANPGLGIRITTDFIEEVEKPLGGRLFAVQRLGVGSWPRTDGLDAVVIAPEDWRARMDVESTAKAPVVFNFDVVPDRSSAAIGVAGWRADKRAHVEVVEHKRGTGWVVDRMVDLVRDHKPTAVVCDGSGPASSLLSDLLKALKDAELLQTLHEGELTLVNAREHAQACGMLYDAVDQDTLRHLGTPELGVAIKGAVKRDLAEAWAWSRKNSSIDISPLVAITLAHWGLLTLQPQGTPQVLDLNAVLQVMRDNGEEV